MTALNAGRCGQPSQLLVYDGRQRRGIAGRAIVRRHTEDDGSRNWGACSASTV